MKLAFALYKYFPFGGLQRDMLAIARECVARGHEVIIFCQGWTGEYAEDPRIEVNILRDNPRWWMGRTNHRRNARFQRDLARALARIQPDLVVSFNRIPGADVYYAADTCFKAKLYGERPWIYRCLPRYRHFLQEEEQVFSRGSRTHILAIARSAIEEYQAHYGTAAERFTLLPPGISRSCINETGERLTVLQEELGLPKDSKIILMVGSGFRTKGLDRAIVALAALPDGLRAQSHLVIAGEDRREPFEQQVRELGLQGRVHFLGGRKDVPRLLRSADVLIHPAYRENTGTVLLEAAVSQLPVLVTSVCGYAHYIKTHQLGIVLPEPFQQAALSAALEKMLSDEGQKQSWRENGQRFASTADIYDMPRHAADVIERSGKQKGAAR